MRRITGAILRVTVPATIMRSDCRGEARNTPAPNRSRSYRDDTLAIISMAQQARPNVIGHKADFLAQLTTASRLVVMMLASNCRSKKLTVPPSALVPFQRPFFPGVPKSDYQDADEYRHLDQAHQAQALEGDGP